MFRIEIEKNNEGGSYILIPNNLSRFRSTFYKGSRYFVQIEKRQKLSLTNSIIGNIEDDNVTKAQMQAFEKRNVKKHDIHPDFYRFKRM